MSSMEVDQLLGKDIVIMLVTYNKNGRCLQHCSRDCLWSTETPEQHFGRKAVGGRYSIGDLVCLYCPAVPKEPSAKFHQPWKGPFEVIKVLSDVTYRIKDTSAMGSQGCQQRKRLIVHFNHLKPCNAGVPLTNESETRPVVQENPPDGQEFNDEEEATLGDIVILPDTDQYLSSPDQVPKEAGRVGPIWSSRIRRTIKPPDHYQPVGPFPRRREQCDEHNGHVLYTGSSGMGHNGHLLYMPPIVSSNIVFAHCTIMPLST